MSTSTSAARCSAGSCGERLRGPPARCRGPWPGPPARDRRSPVVVGAGAVRQRHGGLGLPAAHPVQAGVHHDPVQPGGDRGVAAEPGRPRGRPRAARPAARRRPPRGRRACAGPPPRAGRGAGGTARRRRPGRRRRGRAAARRRSARAIPRPTASALPSPDVRRRRSPARPRRRPASAVGSRPLDRDLLDADLVLAARSGGSSVIQNSRYWYFASASKPGRSWWCRRGPRTAARSALLVRR